MTCGRNVFRKLPQVRLAYQCVNGLVLLIAASKKNLLVLPARTVLVFNASISPIFMDVIGLS